jgi:hypothetical protein
VVHGPALHHSPTEAVLALYLISYDLLKPGKNYDSLIDALTQQGAKRVLLSQWILNTYCSAKQVRDWARRHMDNNDRILISEIKSNWSSYGTFVDLDTG